jgi:hypothetical protein
MKIGYYLLISIVLFLCINCQKNKIDTPKQSIINDTKYLENKVKAVDFLTLLQNLYDEESRKENMSPVEVVKIEKLHFLIRKIKTIFFLENENQDIIMRIGQLTEKDFSYNNELIKQIMKNANPIINKDIEFSSKFESNRTYFVYLVEILDEIDLKLFMKKNKTEYEKKRDIDIAHSINEIDHALLLGDWGEKEVANLYRKIAYFKELANMK